MSERPNLSIPGECFREVGILWTAAFPPGALERRDAAGDIALRMAAPYDAIETLVALADQLAREAP